MCFRTLTWHGRYSGCLTEMGGIRVAVRVSHRESIAIPGLPLLYSDPDMCPWMLVVGYHRVYIPFSLYLSYGMCWAGLFQVG